MIETRARTQVDILKVLAMISVIVVHSFLSIVFYKTALFPYLSTNSDFPDHNGIKYGEFDETKGI